MNHLNIFALGGLDENGKNCYILEFNDEIYIINSGAKIPINSSNGVDTLIPDFTYLEKNKDRIKGIFISDVKNDSFSALPWLAMKLPKIKIYSSPFNKIMILERLSKYSINPENVEVISFNKEEKVDSLTVKPIIVAGSLPGSIGFDFITPDGDIIFLFNYVKGDLGIYGNTNFDEIKSNLNNRNVIAIVTDAGRSNHKGYAIEKIKLPLNLIEDFEKALPNQRIIVGAYDEEMVSLHQILDLAKKHNRPVIPYGKTYGQLLYLIKQVKPDLELPTILDYRSLNKHENAVILITGAVERLYNRFLRITDNKDVLLKLKPTDKVIMMAPPVNGLESLQAVCLDEVARITPQITDASDKDYFFHRPIQNDIIDLVEKLNPKYIIPVQGLYRHLVDISNALAEYKGTKKTKSLILQNGKIAHFIDGVLFSQNGKIKNVGDTIIDGFDVGNISSEVINERELLGRDGLILVVLHFNSKTKEISNDMKIEFVGVIGKDEKVETTNYVKEIISDVVENEVFKGIKDLQERLRKVIRKKIFKLTDKEPLIAVSFTIL